MSCGNSKSSKCNPCGPSEAAVNAIADRAAYYARIAIYASETGGGIRWGYIGDGVQSSFNIDGAATTNTASFLVTINGVVQDPLDYTIAQGYPYIITMNSPVPSGDEIVIVSLNGKTGATGPAGGATGPIGATGLQGPAGSAGVGGGIRWQYIGDGILTQFNISGAVTTLTTAYLVAIDGIIQDPNNYTIASGAPYVLTMSSPVPNGSSIIIVSLNGMQGATGFGSTGASGATGLMGATGVIGTTGATGLTGSTGPTGATGATGLTGSTGPNGSTGATGTAGSNGSTGATGTAGSNGSTGATGTAGSNGSTGATGIAGDKYTTSSSTTLTIALGTQSLTVGTGLALSIGQSVIIANSSSNKMEGTVTSYNSLTGALVANVTLIIGSGSFSSWSVSLSGAPGPQGATGATGVAGTNGSTGATGATGVAGTNGTNGSTGATGVAGGGGATGATGPQGATGVLPTTNFGNVWSYTGDGTTTVFAITGGLSTLAPAYLVNVDGIYQKPANYTISAITPRTLTFSTVPNGSEITIVSLSVS
jgi:hypothetical protein